MKIAIITALNERPQVSQIIFNTWKRLRKDFPTYHIDIVPVCHMHEPDMQLCRDNGAIPLLHKGNIASDKFNAGLDSAYRAGYDAYLIMGDDDSISSDGFDMLTHNIMMEDDYVGFTDNYYVNWFEKKAMIHDYKRQTSKCDKLIGAGRMLSHSAVSKCMEMVEVQITRDHGDGMFTLTKGQRVILSRDSANYLMGYGYAKPTPNGCYGVWPTGLNKSLDHYSELRLVLCGVVPKSISFNRPHITDFKINRNIHDYGLLSGKCTESTVDDACWFMSDSEKEYLQTIK